MDYGVTPAGFVRPRMSDIRADIVEDLRRRAGVEIETRPDSITGQLIDSVSERHAALWEQVEAIANAMYPSTASGLQLDRAVSFTGVRRLQEARSSAYLLLYGRHNTRIAVGAQVRNTSTSDLYVSSEDVTISRSAASACELQVDTAQDNTKYEVLINGKSYSYTTGTSASLNRIISELVTRLSATGYAVASNGSKITVAAGIPLTFSISVSDRITINRLATPALFWSVDFGPISGDTGDLSTIATPVDGWDAVTNPAPASAGRYMENDAELRARYVSGMYRLGSSTQPAIAANLLDRVPGIMDVRVFANSTDQPDAAGRPAHSVHVVVAGGLERTIAESLFGCVSAGTPTHGAITHIVQDQWGHGWPISFDRPQPVYVWLKVRITVLPVSEQQFPGSGFEMIASRIASDAAATYAIGDDVVLGRAYKPIYSVPGIAEATITVASSTDPEHVPAEGEYQPHNVTIADYQIARFDYSRINVT